MVKWKSVLEVKRLEIVGLGLDLGEEQRLVELEIAELEQVGIRLGVAPPLGDRLDGGLDLLLRCLAGCMGPGGALASSCSGFQRISTLYLPGRAPVPTP